MKKIIILLILVVSVISGCTIYKTYNGDSFKDFNKNILKEYQDIVRLQLDYSISNMKFTYTVEKGLSEVTQNEIFEKTRDFIQNEIFQLEFFSNFFKKYEVGEGETTSFPDARIIFKTNEKNGAHVLYYSDKNETFYKIEKFYTSYDNWKYSDESGKEYNVVE